MTSELQRQAARLLRGVFAAGLSVSLLAGAAAAQQADLFNRKMSCREAQTGESRVQIAGGQDADVRKFPFIVQLNVGGALCGGSLIAPGIVLTAAHCVMPQPGTPDCRPSEPGRCELTAPGDFTVTRPDLSGRAAGDRRGVKRVFAHPKFNYGYNGNYRDALNGDVAILILDRPFDVTDAEVVRIADARMDASFASGGQCARVAGWGLTDVLDSNLRTLATGPRTSKLQALNLELVPQRRCRDRYTGQITDNMLCAGDGVEGYNTCKGDSGGPLVVDVGVPIQVGVVSWAYGCAQNEHYTVFARLGAEEVRGWIDELLLP